MNPSLQSLVEKVLEDAARRTGMPVTRLQVLSAESVTWSDGSLGCPQEGMNYTQALVSGFLVRVQAGDELLEYHAGKDGKAFLCPPESALPPLPDGAI